MTKNIKEVKLQDYIIRHSPKLYRKEISTQQEF